MRLSHPFHLLRFACVAGLLGACSPSITTHGHRLDQARIEAIRPGATSREEVLRLLGSPSSVASFDSRGQWYYISQRREQTSFFDTQVTAQDVIAITFDGRGIVERVERRGLDQANAVEPTPDQTRTRGNEPTLVQQLLGNIGRFNPSPSGGPGGQR